MEEVRLSRRLDLLDEAVKGWAKITRDQLRRRLASMGVHARVQLQKKQTRIRIGRTSAGNYYVRKEKPLHASLGYALKHTNTVLTGVGISMERHGIFFERGVGKGRKVGSPAAEAASRNQKWLSVVLPNQVDELANMLEQEYADIIAAEIRILIPGIFDSTVNGGSNTGIIKYTIPETGRVIGIVIDPSFF